METNSNNCPPTHLALGIIGTLLGCFPFGVLAILKSVEVTSLYRAGDFFGAGVASSRAKAFGILSIILSVLIIVAVIALIVVLACDADICQFEQDIEELFDDTVYTDFI